MEKKKPTNAQLQSKISNALVFVPKDKETKSVFFDDRWLRLSCTMDYAVIETMSHRHVFDFITSSGYSKPALYISNFIDLAIVNDSAIRFKDEKGNVRRSFELLIKHLESKEDKKDYNMAVFFSWYLYNVFQPLFSIGEDNIGQFRTWYEYASNIALNSVMLEEHKEAMSNKQFYERWKELMDKFFDEQKELVLFEAKSDEERKKEEIEAMKEMLDKEMMNGEKTN